MICQRCNKDHKVKNEGELTVCEREGYFKYGAEGRTSKNEKIMGFGLGQNRFQHAGAK
jgi:hypothetical protein